MWAWILGGCKMNYRYRLLVCSRPVEWVFWVGNELGGGCGKPWDELGDGEDMRTRMREREGLRERFDGIDQCAFDLSPLHGFHLSQLTQPPSAFECSEILSRLYSYSRSMGYPCSNSKNLEITQNSRMANPQGPLPLLASIHATRIRGRRWDCLRIWAQQQQSSTLFFPAVAFFDTKWSQSVSTYHIYSYSCLTLTLSFRLARDSFFSNLFAPLSC